MSELSHEKLMSLYRIIMENPIPKGFSSISEDIDVDIFEYDSYIMGCVSSYFKGTRIDPENIDLGNDIDKKLDDCIKNMMLLKEYKNRLNEIAQLLITSLENNK